MPNIIKKRSRILAFDLLRGLFLVIIIINHAAVSFGRSFFIIFTGASQLPASAAEGFFMISGIMVGYVYGPKILTSTRQVFIKIWKRAALLWLLCVLFTFIFTAWVLPYPESEKFQTLYSKDGLSFIINTLTLRFSFGWADFLARYAWFMLFAPFALWLIAKKLWWLVACISIAVWYLLRTDSFFYPFPAWQVVFMMGIITGYYFPQIEIWFRQLTSLTQKIIFHTVVWTSVFMVIITTLGIVVLPWIAESHPKAATLPPGSFLIPAMDWLAQFTNKDYLDPIRLLIGTLWFAGLYIVFRQYEPQIDRLTRGTLQVFGKNALYVYSVHAFILFAIDVYFRPPGGSSNFFLNTIITATVLILIYYATKYRLFIISILNRILGNR